MTDSPVSPQLLLLLGVRQIRARLGRAFLTMLAVVIGVAGIVAVTTATSATRHAYADMYAAIAGRAAMEVVSESGGTLPETLVDKIESIDGVRTAAPLLQRPTSLHFGDLKVQAVILGVDPERDKVLHDFILNDGDSLEAEDGAVLDFSFARSCGIEVGDEIKLFMRGGRRRVEVVGLVTPGSISGARLGGTIWITLERAQRWTRLPGHIDSVQIVLDDDGEDGSVRKEVEQVLPPGAVLRDPDADARLVEDHMLSAATALNVGSMYTLLSAAFIILNTFVMNVTERRRELGILRAIGATRGQVTRLLLSEGLLLGALGTVVGIGVGLAGAWALTRAMEGLFAAALPGLRIEPWSLAAGIACGMGISLVATFFPARRASRVSPVEAMRRGPAPSAANRRHGLLIAGIPLAAIGILGLVGAVNHWVEARTSVPSGLLLLIGIILLIPTFLPYMLRGAAVGVTSVVGIAGRIAQRQLLRWRTRTALTVGVVFVAVSTGIGLGNSLLSSVDDVRSWYRQTLAADFFVRGVYSSMVTGAAAEMSDETGRQIAKIPGVQRIDATSFHRCTVNEKRVLVVAREFNKYEKLPLDVKEGDPVQLQQSLKKGQVALGTVLAERMNLHAGDFIELSTKQGERRLRVAGVVTDYQVGGMVLYMERQAAQKALELRGVDVHLVRAKKGSTAAVEAALQKLCKKQGLILQSYAELARTIDGLMSGLQAGSWAILALQFMVAGFGVANTLTMNVMEQTREIGLLRVVGMTRSQARRMIFTQAGLIGSVSLAMGLPGGIIVAWVLNLCSRPVTGHQVAFTLHPWLFVGGALMALAIVIAAAWFPAERAVRLETAEALAYE